LDGWTEAKPLYGWASHFMIEGGCKMEQAIAKGLGIESATIPSPSLSVVRVGSDRR
jgi:hypothetical protein